MYKFDRNHQFSLIDFNQPIGFKMNTENRWVKKASMIPWELIEEKYAKLFKGYSGMPAKPLRTALGSLLIQKQLGFSDRELVEEIRENPYFQYFIGLPGYKDEIPFVPSLLVAFRKRLTDEVLEEINEMIIEYNTPDKPNGGSSGNEKTDSKPSEENSGTVILDATCAPQNISYPQDINLLNEARENIEGIIDTICDKSSYNKPRMYRKNARKDYLNLAKSKRRTVKKIRKAIKSQLQYIHRDLRYLEILMSDEKVKLTGKQLIRLATIYKLVEQQQYMYDNKVHSVQDRIVSISQPYIRPIVRGKVKAPVEFGAKLDLSIDEKGVSRLERLSYDAYNESDVLIGAVERYRERTGHYPERMLADQIYRNRKNRAYCTEHGIRISGPALGRPKKEPLTSKKQEYTDNTDRIEVERAFSLAKRRHGLGLVKTKLDDTTKSSIVLSIISMNLNHLLRVYSHHFLYVNILMLKQDILSLIFGGFCVLELEPNY
jgi:IS5 family transposase